MGLSVKRKFKYVSLQESGKQYNIRKNRFQKAACNHFIQISISGVNEQVAQ